MRIYELINNPSIRFSSPFRIYHYLDDGDEAIRVFDSVSDADIPPDILMREITAVNTGEDGVMEIEYVDMLGDVYPEWMEDAPHRIAAFYSDEWREDIIYNKSDAEQDSEVSGQGAKSGKFYVLTIDDNGAPIRAELVQ